MTRRATLTVGPILTVSALLGGCRSSVPPSQARSYTVGDTLVVENARPRVPRVLLPVEVARYGRADGPSGYLLRGVRTFAVDDRGSVFVYEAKVGIHEFAADGTFVRFLARFGRGPGEVQYPTAMAATDSDVVAAVDPSNLKVVVLGRSEEPWVAHLYDGFPPYGGGAVGFHRDGSLWLSINPSFDDAVDIPHPRAVYARVRDDGAYVDTVFTPANAAVGCPTLSSSRFRAGFWEDDRDPFVPMVKWALGPDGTLVVGCPATYSFTIYRPLGRVVRVRRGWKPVEVSREEYEFRQQMPVPKSGHTLPAYVKIIVPGDGRVWIWPRKADFKDPLLPEVAERFGVTHTWSLPFTGDFDVFSEEGEWLAVVRLPTDARYSGYPTEANVVVRGDTLWAAARDSLDVDYVVRYEVRGLAAATGS